MAKLSNQSNTANTVKIITEAFDFLHEHGWEGTFSLTTPTGDVIHYTTKTTQKLPTQRAKRRP